MNRLNFRESVESIVNQIPIGRLMTYGQIAALAGNPQAARIVGGIAHFGDPSLPWQRVVNKKGMLALGYPGGRSAQKKDLENEGVTIVDYRAPIDDLRWWPDCE